MRAHASVLRGARRPRRFKRELLRLLRADARTYNWGSCSNPGLDRLVDEFRPQLRDLLEELRLRRERLAAIESLYGEWEVHV